MALREAGQRLYDAIVETYEHLEPHELEQLISACELRDMVERLQDLVDTNGMTETGAAGQVKLSSVIGELRQHRLALSKLLTDLALPADDEVPLQSPASQRAARAAKVRHDRDRRRISKVG